MAQEARELNEHIEITEALLRSGSDAKAQAEATLSLAYEQRTANLIALINSPKIKFNQKQMQMLGEEALARVGITVVN
jgi:hypothetical protein